MPSLIPNYEYDIFISYRQKDNLPTAYGRQAGEGWVTEFVTNLKRELDVTFKEEISVYVDENSYDGIREVHEVNESLASKLKCIIFIPIISQTYCDTKCYAWNNEFLIFKQLALTDQIGLKVKLQNGNVASRIVPVRIHELDVQDGLLIMKELGGPLRSIDFIFRTPGVNRPLRANEDHPNDNRNKTYYADQINKVANSIKEIINALQSPGSQGAHKSKGGLLTPIRNTFSRKRVLTAASIATMLFLLTYFLLRNDFNSFSNVVAEKTTIAVIPFKSIGDEEESKNFADGVTDVIVSNLIMFPELKVKSRTSVEKYKDHLKSISEIGSELGVLYVLEGSAQKIGDNIRIIVQLIDTRTDVNVWSERFDKKFENIFEIQNQISVSIARSLQAKLTPAIAEKIKRGPTSNFEAYDLFLRAKQWVNRFAYSQDPSDLDQAIKMLNQSLKRDARFAAGYAWLAGLKFVKEGDNLSKGQVKDSILLLAEKAISIDSTVVEAYIALSALHFRENDDINALRFTYKALEHIDGLTMDANISDSVLTGQLVERIASVYARIGDADRAANLYNQILKLDSTNLDILHQKFYPLASGRHIDRLIELSDQIELLDARDPFSDVVMTHVFLEQHDFESLEKMYRKKENALSEQITLLDHYVLVYASALRRNGKEKEALAVARKFESDLISGGPYLQAQLLIFLGQMDEGLDLLNSVDIGWYNLNLCVINPVFELVKNEARFKNFIKRNNDRIQENSDRIYQFEKDGYLPHPEIFLERVLFGNKSGFSGFDYEGKEPAAWNAIKSNNEFQFTRLLARSHSLTLPSIGGAYSLVK